MTPENSTFESFIARYIISTSIFSGHTCTQLHNLLYIICHMISKFTEDYLKDYKEQIRKLPLDELYEVLDIIRKDDSPERQDIVKARIAEIEDESDDEPNAAPSAPFPKHPSEPDPDLNDTQISVTNSELADAENDDSSTLEITQEELDKINNTQHLPDSDGCFTFVFFVAIGFGIALFALVGGSMSANRTAGFHDLKITTVLPYFKYVPIASILFFYYLSTKEKIRNYWLNHLKLALGIASFLAVNATTTFFTGTYSGIYRSCSGTPAYIIATGILLFSILFIANAFYPISKKIRPKYGLTLLALALILETALR